MTIPVENRVSSPFNPFGGKATLAKAIQGLGINNRNAERKNVAHEEFVFQRQWRRKKERKKGSGSEINSHC